MPELRQIVDKIMSNLEEYFDKDGRPKKCTTCGGTEFDEITKDTINYTICEYEVVCETCSETLGYWAYGSFDPSFIMSYNGDKHEFK